MFISSSEDNLHYLHASLITQVMVSSQVSGDLCQVEFILPRLLNA